MTDPYLPFCSSCGTRFQGRESRCSRCGTPRKRVADQDPAGSGRPVSLGVPWQTVVGAQQDDITALASAAAVTPVQGKARSPLARLGIGLLITAALDAFVANLYGGSVFEDAIWRDAVAALTGLLSLLAGSARQLRKVAGLFGALASVMYLLGLGNALTSAVATTGGMAAVLPQLITVASSLFLSIRNAVVALRRPR